MAEQIPKDVSDLLETILDEKIENFKIQKHEGNAKGQGFLGEMIFISLKNKNTDKNHHLVVKQVLNSSTESTKEFMSSSFFSEIHFYTKVIPSIKNFQKSYPGVRIFDHTPECYGTISEIGKEKIVLQNLKFDNYELHPKVVPLDDQMYEAIFKLYGKYHGVSFAFKHHQPETFNQLGSTFRNNFLKFIENGLMARGIKGTCYRIKEFLDEEHEEKIAEKFQKYVDNGVQLYVDAINHKSPYEVILHGDCWSNNMLFKYNESRQIEDIQMLDFQMSMLGSPTIDLTYSFYSGATKETLDKYEHFLKIYHRSLSDTLKDYGCNVDKIYPYEALKKEWKECTAFGFVMGLLLWFSKNMEEDETVSVAEVMDAGLPELEREKQRMIKKNENIIKKASLDLTRYMYENDLL